MNKIPDNTYYPFWMIGTRYRVCKEEDNNHVTDK